ncbi:hypothetical protein BV133_1041 [Blastochloris viridis]|uniref:Uncharacterized protein n=1 Tax=Blastochloris viridis TaxID=1079 RepID=A0A182CZS8_BLAVI|nr:hypothetical protein BV133_1041 [Blastochloris viridis]
MRGEGRNGLGHGGLLERPTFARATGRTQGRARQCRSPPRDVRPRRTEPQQTLRQPRRGRLKLGDDPGCQANRGAGGDLSRTSGISRR